MSIKHSLVEEFNSELEELNTMQVGSDNYKIAVDGITKLADRIIELEKFEKESEAKRLEDSSNFMLKQETLENEKKDKIIKNILQGLGIGVSAALYVGAFIGSMNFEKTGHIFGTEAGRNSLKSMFKLRF